MDTGKKSGKTGKGSRAGRKQAGIFGCGAAKMPVAAIVSAMQSINRYVEGVGSVNEQKEEKAVDGCDVVCCSYA